ncbi:MAG: extracellular solute-binding protein [Trueperaceae bacterium]|nr:extracellular solute-binding protein [Trueperaceae bacterium]
MKHRSIIFILLVISLAFAQEIELTIAHGMTGGADRTAFDQIVAAFEAENPNIKVTQIAQDDDLYEDTGLITLLQSNDPPDIFFEFGGERVASNAANGFAADLTEALTEENWQDSFIEAAWSAPAGTMVDGRVYMIPTNLDVTTVIWYDKATFDEFGLSEPETWTEFVDLVKTLSDNGVTPIIFGNQEFWPFGNWAGHIVARVVSAEKFDAAFRLEEPFNQAEFVTAFGYFEQLAEVNAFNADMPSLGADPAMSAFFNGAAAMHPIGSWLVSTALDSAPEDFQYDAFNTPLIPGGLGDPNSIIGLSTGYQISAKTEHFAEAVAFMKFFTSKVNQITWAEAGAFSPVHGAMEEADLNEHTKKLAQLFAEASSIVPPPDTGYPQEIADIFYQGAAYVAAGLKSPEDALMWVDEQLAPMKN